MYAYTASSMLMTCSGTQVGMSARLTAPRRDVWALTRRIGELESTMPREAWGATVGQITGLA